MFSRWAAMILCVHLSLLGITLGQQPEPTSISSEMAQRQRGIATLTVLVLDRDGQALSDLKQNELELYEGKEERPIESISRMPEAPIMVGFLIDTSNSVSGPLHALKWKDDSDPAGELLRTGDLAFVATFTQNRTLMCQLTPDLGQVRTALHTAFTARLPTGVTSVYDAIFWASSKERSVSSGHKALIVLSDMEDNMSQHTRVEAIAQAQQFAISIYPISLGPTGPRGEMAATSMADNTGGITFTAYSLGDLKKTFRSIRSDIENRYVVAYRPKSMGSSHVKIRCTRKGAGIVAPDQGH